MGEKLSPMKTAIRIVLICMFLTGITLADQSSPYNTVDGFYNWFLKAGDRYRDSFSQAKPYFSEELYGLLNDGFSKRPGDGFWVDFDPFSNSQMGMSKVSVGKPHTVSADLAMVPVTPHSTRPMDAEGNTAMPVIKVYVCQVGNDWKIANLVYTGDYPFQLKKYLQDGLGKSAANPDSRPISETSYADIRPELLHGTWRHQASSKTADGEARPLDIAVIKWTFKPGGKCDFYQKVGSGKARLAEDRPFTLKDNTITLGARTKYTVVKHTGEKMIWKNHRLGDFYHVVRE